MAEKDDKPMKTGYRCGCGGIAIVKDARRIGAAMRHRAKCGQCGEWTKAYYAIEENVVLLRVARINIVAIDAPNAMIDTEGAQHNGKETD